MAIRVKIKSHSILKRQCYVTKALLRREMITRLGNYKLGVIWILMDPLISVIFLGLILGPILGRSKGEMPYVFFLLCGFMLMKTMTGPINSGMGAINANKGLLLFRQVKPIDPFIARFIFSFLSNFISFIVFCTISVWFGVILSNEFIYNILIAFVLTWLIGCGIGLALGVACLKMKELEKVQQYVQRPLIFISCVIIPLSAIPEIYKSYLLWNPLVHTIEIARNSLSPSYIVEDVNLYYPFICAIMSLSVGLMVYWNNRHFLMQR